jgi:hypothetical protein
MILKYNIASERPSYTPICNCRKNYSFIKLYLFDSRREDEARMVARSPRI